MADEVGTPDTPPLTPRQKILRSETSRQDSVRSNQSKSGRGLNRQFSRQSTISGSIRYRPSLRRMSSLSLPHHDAFKGLPEKKISNEGVPWWTSHRFRLSLICFCGFFCLYAQRVNLSIAIVCMVKDAHLNSNNNVSLADENNTISYNKRHLLNVLVTANGSDLTSTVATIGNSEKRPCPQTDLGKFVTGEFSWDKHLQGLILGAFFWGYTALQIPGGWLAERFGPHKVISVGMGMVSALTILTPVCARASPYLLVVCRVLIGVGEATMYPGAQVLWAKWAPPAERSRLVGFAFGGTQLGNALSFPIASLLCAYGFDGGWPSVFYILGLLSCLWWFFWLVFVRNSPEEMPSIKIEEKKYILLSIGDKGHHKNNSKNSKPWKAIMTSGAVWGIMIANACGNYGAYMLLTQMPTYMKEVLHFDIKSNGTFSMIPYLSFWMFIVLAGIFADFFISREILSIGNTRKLCGAIGMFFPAIFLVLLGYMDCFKTIEAVVLLSISMAFCGFQFSSFFINHGDIAPEYAGTIFGITNTGASIPGIIAPYVVGAITQNKLQSEWQVAFYIAAAVYCVGAVAYICLAQGEVQKWADVNKSDEAETELEGIKEEHSQDFDHPNGNLENSKEDTALTR